MDSKIIDRRPFILHLFRQKMVLYNQQEKKMKIIPKAAFESQKDTFVDSPKVRSRRFPCKVMFLGVVCPPDKNHNIDGKVYLR